jgi:hypothetical protein
MTGSIIEDVANLLADMPNQTLPVYSFLFPLAEDSGIINCIAIFPAGSGLTNHPGTGPLRYSNGSGIPQAIDTPNFQVQVRYTDPINAFARCEAIRKWLDENPPTGYVLSKTNQGQPRDMTSPADLALIGSPAYRYEVSFEAAKVRA